MEFKIIEEIWKIFKRDPKELLGIDDSVAVKLFGKENILVMNVDTFDETTDWLPGLSFYDAGWKSTISSLSDVVVKGGKPLGCLVSLGIPNTLSTESIKEFYLGVRDVCKEHGLRLWGGDLNESKVFYASVVSVGLAKKVIPRNGAKPGDVVFSTGLFSINSLAYKILLNGLSPPDRFNIDHVYRPKIPTFQKWSNFLSYITSSIDSSDGLALSLNLLAKASKVKIVIDEELVLDPFFKEICEKIGLDPLKLALYEGGEEYTFLFTVHSEYEKNVLKEAEAVDLEVYKIGYVDQGEGVWVKRREGKIEKVHERGWIQGKRWGL